MNGKAKILSAVVGVAVVLLAAGLLIFHSVGSRPATEVNVSSEAPAQEGSRPATALPESSHVQPVEVAPVPPRVMVEIQGAVATPGFYSFPSGARVFDALEKAGGPLENAEIRDLNIAALLVDGSVMTVPYRQQNGAALQPGASDLNPPSYTRSGWAGDSGTPPASGQINVTAVEPSKVNLNTATQAELETLPGVGPKTAEKIIHFRETQPFSQIEDLRFIQGIGDKRLETLRPHVTVE